MTPPGNRERRMASKAHNYVSINFDHEQNFKNYFPSLFYDKFRETERVFILFFLLKLMLSRMI
jgi:hypothetical protein